MEEKKGFFKIKKQILWIGIFVLLGGGVLMVDQLLVPSVLGRLDQAAEARDVATFAQELENLNFYSNLWPRHSALGSLMGYQKEFMSFQKQTIKDKRGALYYLQGLKARIQESMATKWMGQTQMELWRRGTVLLSAISGFEATSLREGIVEVQKEALKYQAEQQLKAYETFGRSLSSTPEKKDK